jgi:enterobactin synthetase component F
MDAPHYGFGVTDRFLQKTPASFESRLEFILPIISGQLVVAPPGAHRDPGPWPH